MSVPVLMYHHILPKNGFIASSIDEFREQMRYLAEKGWTTLTSEQFYRYKMGLYMPPKKSVLITFDDGWRDNFIYAYPILKEFGLRATMFLVTQWIEKASQNVSDFEPLQHKIAKNVAPSKPSAVFLSWNDIEKMGDIFDFHSHTHTHKDGYFEKIEWDEEFEKSQIIIKQRLGFEDYHLCWPRGIYDEQLVEQAKKAGFKILYTTQRGVNKPDGKTEQIKRIASKNGAAWLAKTLFIFSNDILGSLYNKKDILKL